MVSVFREKIFEKLADRLSIVLHRILFSDSDPGYDGSHPIKLRAKHAKEIYSVVIQEIIEAACFVGKWTLPKGFGSLIVKRLSGGKRIHPKTGDTIRIKDRERLRYKAGTKVEEILGNKC